ncbi:MAG TPA: SDR family NAD(P)-dependent oxidoreductase, partial [Arachnia sp.]|nr:SDR family NAD(P)-dependent oxidoreductase [Arachnia sp.]
MNGQRMQQEAIGEAAEELATRDGGFPEQEQQPPGLTTAMTPVPDHGEETWIGRGRLEGLRALITGGDSGIGRAVAIAFAREGADVAISYLAEEQSDAEDVAAWVEREQRTCVLLPGDIRDEETCRNVVDDAARQLGGLDVLVNNAGYQWARREHGLEDVTTEEMDRVFRTNLYALIWITQQALTHMGEGASIINVSSIQANEPSAPLIDYAATKAA